MFFNSNENRRLLAKLYTATPYAKAKINGGKDYPNICGEVLFYNFDDVCVVSVTFHNLPQTDKNIFGFHIHENGNCEGDFSSAGEHFGSGTHPNHKGDMPPIFSCNGNSFTIFCLNKFEIKEIINKSIILHKNVDDFTTQPSGNSGERIACGIIKKN